MEPHASKKIWTYDDLLAMPEDRSKRYEIFDGDLVVSPMPRIRHQQIVQNLGGMLLEALQKRRIARVHYVGVDVVFAPTRVAVPDVVVIRARRRNIVGEQAIEAAPDLVVEVLSRSAKRDRVTKRSLYARSGVPEYWIIDPKAETVEVLALTKGRAAYHQAGLYGRGERVRSVGFELDLAVDEIFAEPEL